MNHKTMIKAFSTTVKHYQVHMNKCKDMYIEALCDDFVHSYVHEDSTIDMLDQGFKTYKQSLHNFTEFKRFCKNVNHENYNIHSQTYLRVLKNTFIQMCREYDDAYVVKSFTNKHSSLGHKLNEFMKLCTKWYIESSSNNPRILNDQEIFFDFCTTINKNLSKREQVDMNSNLCKVYFDDYFCSIIVTYLE